MISVERLRESLSERWGGLGVEWWDAWYDGEAEYVPASRVELFLHDHADRIIG